ncbi:MAG: class I SAM-dependent methyltransferase, partial [Planctomycetota bacterium]
GKNGLIIGLDINHDLLKKARRVGSKLITPAIVLPWDFNQHPYPLLDNEADILTAPFSAYYTEDTISWVEDTHRVVKSGGRLILLGPTKNNAQELYDLNKAVTGIGSVQETDETSTKLEESFLPELQKRLGNQVKKTILDRQIVFPSPEEFALYYFATWLYERTQEKVEETIEFESVVRALKERPLKLNKEVICIEALKP